ncbi:MAG: hypothetical protein Q4B44_06400 [Erysipelotrichaceae bacterium]|nr:hypothetical protein [Erysipelotrichaceae bacterium]
MERRYGKVNKGYEDEFTPVFFAIESNMMIVHRKHRAANGRRAKEAVMLALHRIEAIVTGEEKDLSAFENPENKLLFNAIMYAIDPLASEKGKERFSQAGGDEAKLKDLEYLHDMYIVPSRCLMRIAESIDMWTKNMGPDGYFNFMEGNMGSHVSDEMNVCFTLPELNKEQQKNSHG